MFSGIIANTSRVLKVSEKRKIKIVAIKKPRSFRAKPGESVSVNGVCSTIVGTPRDSLVFEYMPETLRKTNVKEWSVGTAVNLEQSLTLNSLIGGHLLAGHIDAAGKILQIQREGNSKTFHINFPREFRRYLIPKGSVAIEGVSLTVVDVSAQSFAVGLIPYTLLHTNLGGKKIGDSVNIEFDLFSKYAESILKHRKIR